MFFFGWHRRKSLLLYLWLWHCCCGISAHKVESDNDALIEAEHNLNILAGGGAISFGNENLSTTGTLECGAITTSATILTGSGANLDIESGASGIRSATVRDDTTASVATCYVGASVGRFMRSTSALKYKDKIKDLELDSSLLYNLRPVSFNSKCEGDDKNKRFHGFIADEIEQYYPEIVNYNENNEAESYDNQMLMTLMLNEMKNLRQEINELKGE